MNLRIYENVVKRITILMDDDVHNKIRHKQAILIKKTKGAVSFSKVLNDSLRECLTKRSR